MGNLKIEMKNLKSEEKYEIKVFLENLRRSGIVNMFGAAPYLVAEFGITKKESIAALIDWMQNYDPDDYRICKKCGKAMTSGFDIAFGLEYYCSEKCLYSCYTKEEYNEMCEEDVAYYTVWDE